MRCSSNRGQSLVEFCLLLQAWVATASLFFILFLKTLLPYLMTLDLYDLSRAHLYGNDLATCKASSLWPRHLVEVRVVCLKVPEFYSAEAFLIWGQGKIFLARTQYGLWRTL